MQPHALNPLKHAIQNNMGSLNDDDTNSNTTVLFSDEEGKHPIRWDKNSARTHAKKSKWGPARGQRPAS